MAAKKKSTLKKAATKASKKAVKKAAAKVEKKAREGRHIVFKILPYVLLLFALVLAIILVIIRLLGLDDGAGVIGYGILWVLGGLWGGGTIFLPLTLGYVGVKWCIHNIKWKEADMNPSSDRYDDYRKARGRLVLQIVMTVLALLFVSVLFGTIADYRDFDLEAMWSDSAEELVAGGGVIGGLIACASLLAFESVLTYVLVIILLLLFILLALGLTPDYIITKIRDLRAARAEARAKELEEERAEAERLAKEEKAAKAACEQQQRPC